MKPFVLRCTSCINSALLFTLAAGSACAADASAPSETTSLLTMLMGLAIVLALMAGIAWLLKRSGITRLQGTAIVKVVGGASVGTRERVMVIEVADQWIVIGVAQGQVNLLSTMPRGSATPAAEAASTAAPNNFSAWLKQTIEKRNANR
ncbi:flagellar biosynthetic protein FliO [Herbaspirillum sp. RTI4]|uniref:flagellar biosynthetic protein FliO n=1 Tax=Herbaspirillum sp. RTI4 TaxID=3048640 RepID=UPI002AB50229|nr:flagellar biosynthetic protein FliO [Herbaspirillum sp. RTI4]MDY7578310.1 flagellar biosynthetic protein FliO [Herbaspirillum sp. RTI4]MEA9981197.1 flagellar biosynthetic protein FliO [Herbaspirillum sp. RTI4]